MKKEMQVKQMVAKKTSTKMAPKKKMTMKSASKKGY